MQLAGILSAQMLLCVQTGALRRKEINQTNKKKTHMVHRPPHLELLGPTPLPPLLNFCEQRRAQRYGGIRQRFTPFQSAEEEESHTKDTSRFSGKENECSHLRAGDM